MTGKFAAAEAIGRILGETLKRSKIAKKDLDTWAETWYNGMRLQFIAIPPLPEFREYVKRGYSEAK